MCAWKIEGCAEQSSLQPVTRVVTTLFPKNQTDLRRFCSSQATFVFYFKQQFYTTPPQSLDLHPIERLWDVVRQEVRKSNQQRLHDAVLSIWTRISEVCFWHLGEFTPRSTKAAPSKRDSQGTHKVCWEGCECEVIFCRGEGVRDALLLYLMII